MIRTVFPSSILAAAILAALAFPLSVSASGWETCRSDWQRYCNSVGDQYSVFQCLQEREEDLAPVCRQFLSKEHARLRAGARKSCGDDYARLCWYVVPGDGRIFRCLQGQLERLSSDCRAHFDTLPDISGSAGHFYTL